MPYISHLKRRKKEKKRMIVVYLQNPKGYPDRQMASHDVGSNKRRTYRTKQHNKKKRWPSFGQKFYYLFFLSRQREGAGHHEHSKVLGTWAALRITSYFLEMYTVNQVCWWRFSHCIPHTHTQTRLACILCVARFQGDHCLPFRMA